MRLAKAACLLWHDLVREHPGAVSLRHAVLRRRLSALYTLTRNSPDEGGVLFCKIGHKRQNACALTTRIHIPAQSAMGRAL